ncbi:MAG TPA: FKBP-type peptidyl-prolyl cis-trans isomerase [Paenalcaligenes sp.]|nr:FKBP-type peptidyl-prolyl cis-trans isomerase [Paenalcaligenes sp.]
MVLQGWQSVSKNSAVGEKIIRPDSYVTLHYRITVLNGPAAGTVFVDTFAMRPATLQMGVGQWSPGLEEQILGLAEGRSHSAVVDAEQAYGPRNPALVQWVSRAQFEENRITDKNYQAGDTVEFSAPTGQRYTGVLKQWKDDQALIDFNHPLAGAEIQIDVQILGIL